MQTLVGVRFSQVTLHRKLLYHFEMLHEGHHEMITKFFFCLQKHLCPDKGPAFQAPVV